MTSSTTGRAIASLCRMTPHHIFYIPSVFILGLVTGAAVSRRQPSSSREARVLIGSLVLLVVMFAITHVMPLAGGPAALHGALGGVPLFDQSPLFSPAAVVERVAAYGPAGRAAYARFTYTADVVFPLTLLLFLTQLRKHVRRPNGDRVMGVMAPAWFLADMMENAMVHTLLTSFPEPHDGIAGILGVVTVLKFGLLALALGWPLLRWARAALARPVAPEPAR